LNVICSVLGWLAAIVWMSVPVALTAGATWWSWHSAPDDCGPHGCNRLRWVVSAREDILPGQQITARLIDEGLKHTSSPVESIAPRGEVEKQYARTGAPFTAPGEAAIKAGSVIERRMVGPMMWVPNTSEVIVPVAVEPELAAGISPEVRVVFLLKADKAAAPVWAGVGTCASGGNPAPAADPAGFTVVSRSDGTDPHKSVVSVRVSPKDAKWVAALSDGVWHPVVIPAGDKELCAPALK
jgi:hypothetical protein